MRERWAVPRRGRAVGPSTAATSCSSACRRPPIATRLPTCRTCTPRSRRSPRCCGRASSSSCSRRPTRAPRREVCRPALEATRVARRRRLPPRVLARARRSRQRRVDGGHDAQGRRWRHRRVRPSGRGGARARSWTSPGGVRQVSTPAAAEMAKLLENTYRNVNIALVNELAQLCHRMGIDVWEVIDAAATKPFGFEAFRPGVGPGRSLHPRRSAVPVVEGARVRLPHRVHRPRGRHEPGDGRLRRRPDAGIRRPARFRARRRARPVPRRRVQAGRERHAQLARDPRDRAPRAGGCACGVRRSPRRRARRRAASVARRCRSARRWPTASTSSPCWSPIPSGPRSSGLCDAASVFDAVGAHRRREVTPRTSACEDARLRRLWGWALEHPILAVFVVALAVRVVVAVGINVVHDGTLFADDRFFFDLARRQGERCDRRSGTRTSATSSTGPRRSSGRSRRCSWLTGSTLLAGQLLVAVAGAGAAALTTAVGVRALRPPWAIAAGHRRRGAAVDGALVVAHPEGRVRLVHGRGDRARGVRAVRFREAVRGRSPRSPSCCCSCSSHLRDHTRRGRVLGARGRRSRSGPGADRRRRAIVRRRRAARCSRCSWATASPASPTCVTRSPASRSAVRGTPSARRRALTCDARPGRAQREDRAPAVRASRPSCFGRIRGRRAGSTSVRLARLEAILWYPLLVAVALRAHPRVAACDDGLPSRRVNGAAIVLVYALTEGNLGTAFRHRGRGDMGGRALRRARRSRSVDRRAASSVRVRPRTGRCRTPTSTLTGGDGG